MRIVPGAILVLLSSFLSGVGLATDAEEKPTLQVVVTDSEGDPVLDCEAMLAVGERRKTSWLGTEDGNTIVFPAYELKEPSSRPFGDDETPSYLRFATLFIRAPGFVTTSHPIEFESDSQTVNIELAHGRTVTLSIQTESGDPVPEDLSPLLALDGYRNTAGFVWRRTPEERKELNPLDHWLGLERVGKGRYQFQASEELPPVYVHVDHPGFLRCYESEPLDWDEFMDGEVTINLPKPGSITANIEFPEDVDIEELPIRSYRLMAGRPLDPDEAGYFQVKEKTYERGDFEFHFDNLAPGQFKIYLSTEPEEQTRGPEGQTANPGKFRDQEEVELEEGEDKTVAIPFRTFDPEPFKGEHKVTLEVHDREGEPVTDRDFEVNYGDENYGTFLVASGTITDGTIKLEDLRATDKMEFSARYVLRMGDHQNRIGGFAVASSSEAQTVTFQLIPDVGDQMPDFAGFDTITGEPFELSRHQGKVILVEFWTTWCGPCQSPMAELNAVAEERADEWRDRVALIAVSLDEERETAKKHLEGRDWVHCRNVWGGDKQSSARENIVANRTGGDFSVTAFPTMLLIDQEGIIRYRGHPGSFDTVSRIEELLGGK